MNNTEPDDDGGRLGALIRACLDEETPGIELSPALLHWLITYR
jgi:hypothetical protein